MFHYFSKILSFLISPYNWLYIGLLSWLLLRPGKWKKIIGWGTLLVFFGCGNRGLVNWVYTQIEPVPRMQETITIPYEYAVVLGGGFAYSHSKFPDRVFFRNHVNRLTECMELFKSGKVKQVILSGGVGGLSEVKDVETNLVKLFLLENGWPDSVITVEPTSKNTFENARNVKAILDGRVFKGKILLITSALHMPRAAGCFKKQGILFDTYTSDYQQKENLSWQEYVIPGTDVFGDWQSILHEWLGTLVYKSKGYL